MYTSELVFLVLKKVIMGSHNKNAQLWLFSLNKARNLLNDSGVYVNVCVCVCVVYECAYLLYLLHNKHFVIRYLENYYLLFPLYFIIFNQKQMFVQPFKSLGASSVPNTLDFL